MLSYLQISRGSADVILSLNPIKPEAPSDVHSDSYRASEFKDIDKPVDVREILAEPPHDGKVTPIVCKQPDAIDQEGLNEVISEGISDATVSEVLATSDLEEKPDARSASASAASVSSMEETRKDEDDQMPRREDMKLNLSQVRYLIREASIFCNGRAIKRGGG